MTSAYLPALALLAEVRRDAKDIRRIDVLSARIEELVISAAQGVEALQSDNEAHPDRRRATRRLQRAVAAFQRPI
jgi:hypothetical protein